jgi:shikimate kinase
MVITLIGYRGTGKSTVAAALGEQLQCLSVDADEKIEASAGKSIHRIFSDDGEVAFRALERQTMHRLLGGQQKCIIAAGGGAVLNEHTRREMRFAGPVVWLTASVDTILARIGSDATTAQRRPDLTADGGRAEVEQLLAIREPLYLECADVIVDTEDRDVAQIVDEIVAALGPRLQKGATE